MKSSPANEFSLPLPYDRSVMQVTGVGSELVRGGVRGEVLAFSETATKPFHQRSKWTGITLAVLVVTGLLLSGAAAGTVAEPSRAARVDSMFARVGTSDPGAAVMVLKDGRVAFARGYGITDLRTLRKIDEHTNFRIASLSKQFTAMAIMLLAHDGKLRYDEPLTEIFPEFPAYGRGITIRHLLNHTSGLLDYEELMAQGYGNTPDGQIPQIQTAEVLVRMEKVNTTKFPPGSQWAYSNSGYCVLAMVVEKVSGQPFRDFLRDRIFGPLHMEHTLAYEKGKNEVPHRAYGHTSEGRGWRETDQSSTSATLGDGGVYTSVSDMARWDRALREHTLLTEEEMKPALAAVQPSGGPALENGRPVSYGFGWFLDSYGGRPRMWHYGETMGFRSSIQRFPADGLTVIVLSNRVDFDASELALKIADLYLAAPTN